MTGPRLATQSLSIGYLGRRVASDITLAVAPAEVVAIVGPSGSGKSTLLATIAGVVPALGGSVIIEGRDVTATAIHERGVGLVFQEPLLFPHLSVMDNVTYGLRRQRAPKDVAQARAIELLDWLGLEGYGPRNVEELSGGQAQRVALARALAPRPAVLLLDEPFSALDSDLRQRLAGDVARMLRHEGVSAIHVTHDLAEATDMSDRVIAFADFAHSADRLQGGSLR
ncbi:MAG: ABC transporter ATP-binding protein [Actinomycetes bacterium]